MQTDLLKAKAVLEEGGIILFPSDRGWCLGCDAANPKAIKRIHGLFPETDIFKMQVLLETDARMEQYAENVPEVAWELLQVSDKPLTLIIPGAKNLAENLLYADGSVAFRIANDNFSRNLIQRFKRPMALYTPKINHKAIVLFDEIPAEWSGAVDYVVKNSQPGRNQSGTSSVIKLGVSGEIQILKK